MKEEGMRNFWTDTRTQVIRSNHKI